MRTMYSRLLESGDLFNSSVSVVKQEMTGGDD
jgi:hypothetical protein